MITPEKQDESVLALVHKLRDMKAWGTLEFVLSEGNIVQAIPHISLKPDEMGAFKWPSREEEKSARK